MQKLILAGSVVLALVLGGFVAQRFATQAKVVTGTEVTWETLAQLDYITGKAPEELKALDGKIVKVPGFMVPLEDNAQNVSEFLLVPSPQACIHVPPPPPNQMVYVKMDEPAPMAYGAVVLSGTLHLTTKKHMYGESSFEMTGLAIEPYR